MKKSVLSPQQMEFTVLSADQAAFAASATQAELVLGKYMNQTKNCTLSEERLILAAKISTCSDLIMVLGVARLVIRFQDGSYLNHRMSGSEKAEAAMAKF
jgi:hypothetical protein